MPNICFQPPTVGFAQEATMMTAGASATPRASYMPPLVPFAPRALIAVPAPVSVQPMPWLAADGEADGPNPYVDYVRRYTPEDGVAFTYKTIDQNPWRTVLRVVVLLFAVIMAFAYQVDASPYPILPRGCRPFGPCPVSVPGDRLALNLLLLAGFGLVCVWILFVEVQVYREVEIRPDCMILDGADVFWVEKFDLGWPRFAPGEEGMQVLTGVYGTRQTEFLKLKAFDDNDRGPAVFAVHLTAAMQQQWEGAG